MKKKLKILYGIQCTGNGHLTRSKEIIKYLEKYYADRIESIDVCLSGTFSQIDLGDLNIKYKFDGLSLDVSDGGISILKTLRNLNIIGLIKSALSVNVREYDVVVSDFEPVTCWAGILRGKNVLGISNQYKFLSNERFLKNLSPNFFSNKMVTRFVCPVKNYIAFDYLKENENDFFPIIRNTIRTASSSSEEFYLCYLSSISVDDQIKFFTLFPHQKFYIFHGDIKEPTDFENVSLRPIDKSAFTKKLVRCRGVICHTGFQTTSECLFLGKKLLVMPIKNQIEQIYNTKTLSKFGVLSADFFDVQLFDDFFENDYSVKLNYVDEMKDISARILNFK